MGLTKDAKVTIGVDGEDDVARAADRALRPWESRALSAQSMVRSMGSAISDTFRQATSDVARGVTAFAALDFASQLRSTIAYREEVARISVAAGRSSDELRSKYAAQEQAILSSRQANAEFAKDIGRLTYDYRSAAQAADSLGVEALAANRSLGEMKGIGREIHDALGGFHGTAEVLGRIRSQAEAFGTIGGPDALRDQFEALAGSISRLSAKTPEDLGKVSALAGALGKGLTPEQAQRAQQGVIGAVTADPRRWERFLRETGQLGKGESIMDEHGHVRDVADVAQKIQRGFVGRWGVDARRVAMQGNNFGFEAGAALMNADFGAVNAAAGLAPSSKAKSLVDEFKGSAAGKFLADQLKMRGGQQDLAGTMMPLVQDFVGFASQNPATAAMLSLMAPGLVAKASSAAITGAGKVAMAGVRAATGTGGLATGEATQLVEHGGEYLTRAQLAKRAEEELLQHSLKKVSLRGAGMMLKELAGPAAFAYDMAEAQYRVLTEIGEDTTTTGAKYLASHGNVPGLLTSQVKQIARAAERSSTPGNFVEALPPALLEQINQSPELQSVAAGALGGQIDLSRLGPELKAAVKEAIREGGIKITLVNATDTPIEAVEEQAAANGGAQ